MTSTSSRFDRPGAGARVVTAARGLDEADLAAEPVEQFAVWFVEAVAAGQVEPEAMALATATPVGVPSARMVLLKGYDRRGFVFYTNEGSHKAEDLAANPVAALTWRWATLDRQVRVTGPVERVGGQEADVYFASRARGSQLGAWASAQSALLPAQPGRAPRAALDDALAAAEARFAGITVPRPPFWGGYRVVPETMELWQGHKDRLHDRVRYRRAGTGWAMERLFP